MEEPLSRPPIHWFTAVQFALSLLAMLGLFGIAFVFLLLGVVTASNEGGLGATGLSALLIASNSFFCGLLLAPSAYYALRRLLGKPATRLPGWPRLLRPTLLIFLLPLVLLLGYWCTQTPGLSWLLPPLHILAVGLPVLWVLYLAVRGLPTGSPQRTWGTFDSGLLLGPIIILIAETIVLLIGVALFIAYTAFQPEMSRDIANLMEKFRQGQVSPEQIQNLVVPWLNQPVILLGVIAFVALIVPIIEEALKPIGVYLLGGSKLTPAAGFAAGALCGAGYALFESLALTSGGSDWAILVTGRIGTAVIHILNTSLMGWALALAWNPGKTTGRRYLRLAVVYLIVILVHGAWNMLTVFNTAESLLRQSGLEPEINIVTWLGPPAPYLLLIMSLAGLVALLGLNSRLRRNSML